MANGLRDLVALKLRVIQHLPKGDLSLIILKGHLLIEELLYVIVKGGVKHPESVEDARLRFSQLAHLARAITYEDRLRPVWDAILAINTLRNMFAHDLYTTRLEDNLRLFARAVAGNNPDAERVVLADPEGQIRTSIEFICGALSGIASRQ
jgi:hypothetical protein